MTNVGNDGVGYGYPITHVGNDGVEARFPIHFILRPSARSGHVPCKDLAKNRSIVALGTDPSTLAQDDRRIENSLVCGDSKHRFSSCRKLKGTSKIPNI